MVGSDVEDHRNVDFEALQSLKLERAEFNNEKFIPFPDPVDHRLADIPAEERLESGVFKKSVNK